MKNDYTKKLKKSLYRLNANERNRYLENYELNYNEVLEDEMLNKQKHENIDVVSREIIDTYNSNELELTNFTIFIRYFNKQIPIIDLAVLMIIILAGSFIYYGNPLGIEVGLLSHSIRSVIYILPIYLILNYAFGLYRISESSLGFEILKKISINIIMCVIWGYLQFIVPPHLTSRILGAGIFAANVICSIFISLRNYKSVS